MAENDIPLEIAISESKESITQYVNALCQKYKIHPAIMLQILQEIIYENRLNTMAQQMMQMRLAQAPTIHLADNPESVRDKDTE